MQYDLTFVKRTKLNKVWFTAGRKNSVYNCIQFLSFPSEITSWCLYICTMFTFILIFCVPKKFVQCVWSLDFWSLLYHYPTFANPILWHKCECSASVCVRSPPTDVAAHIVSAQCEKYDSNIWLEKVELVWHIIQNGTSSGNSMCCARPGWIMVFQFTLLISPTLLVSKNVY